MIPFKEFLPKREHLRKIEKSQRFEKTEKLNNIEINLRNIEKIIPENARLVVVSKTQSAERIREVYDLGKRIFAENKVQEILAKYHQLPNDISWRFIGHLQTNKVKYIIPFISMIESVDSEKVLIEINKEAKKKEKKIDCLLQLKIAQEESKFGFEFEKAREVFQKYVAGNFANISIKGLMGMASLTNDKQQVKQEFQRLKQLFDELGQIKKLSILSMGMSSDYLIALQAGSTSVRVGSAVFGERNYCN